MPYLICENCGGYYELKEDESPDDFEDKCHCGAPLKYVESLKGANPDDDLFDNDFVVDSVDENLKMDNHQHINNNLPIDNDHSIDYNLQSEDISPFDKSSDSYPDSGDGEGENKSHLAGNLFRISAIMGVMAIIIVAAGIITYQSGSYGVFTSNENEKYSDDEINTFMESAFSPDDYGNSYNKVGKWNINVVRIKVIGTPTKEDLDTLNRAINDINANVKEFQLKIDNQNQMEPDMEIYFIPHSEFTRFSVNPLRVDGFTMWMVSTSGIYGGNSAGEIFKARVIIGTDQKSQQRRSHVIIHELAHGLGLHHNQNKNSALCQYGPDFTKYSDLDKTMMRILYRKDILPNMSSNQVGNILNNSKNSFF